MIITETCEILRIPVQSRTDFWRGLEMLTRLAVLGACPQSPPEFGDHLETGTILTLLSESHCL